jgi:hypothetical protein
MDALVLLAGDRRWPADGKKSATTAWKAARHLCHSNTP